MRPPFVREAMPDGRRPARGVDRTVCFCNTPSTKLGGARARSSAATACVPKKRKLLEAQRAEPDAPRGRQLAHLRSGACEGVLTKVMSRIPLSDMAPYVVARACTWFRDLYHDAQYGLWSQLYARSGGASLARGRTPVAATPAEIELEARKRCNVLLRSGLLNSLTRCDLNDFQQSKFRRLRIRDLKLKSLSSGDLPHVESSRVLRVHPRPAAIGECEALRELSLCNCRSLESLPESEPSSL